MNKCHSKIMLLNIKNKKLILFLLIYILVFIFKTVRTEEINQTPLINYENYENHGPNHNYQSSQENQNNKPIMINSNPIDPKENIHQNMILHKILEINKDHAYYQNMNPIKKLINKKFYNSLNTLKFHIFYLMMELCWFFIIFGIFNIHSIKDYLLDQDIFRENPINYWAMIITMTKIINNLYWIINSHKVTNVFNKIVNKLIEWIFGIQLQEDLYYKDFSIYGVLYSFLLGIIGFSLYKSINIQIHWLLISSIFIENILIVLNTWRIFKFHNKDLYNIIFLPKAPKIFDPHDNKQVLIIPNNILEKLPDEILNNNITLNSSNDVYKNNNDKIGVTINKHTNIPSNDDDLISKEEIIKNNFDTIDKNYNKPSEFNETNPKSKFNENQEYVKTENNQENFNNNLYKKTQEDLLNDIKKKEEDLKKRYLLLKEQGLEKEEDLRKRYELLEQKELNLMDKQKIIKQIAVDLKEKDAELTIKSIELDKQKSALENKQLIFQKEEEFFHIEKQKFTEEYKKKIINLKKKEEDLINNQQILENLNKTIQEKEKNLYNENQIIFKNLEVLQKKEDEIKEEYNTLNMAKNDFKFMKKDLKDKNKKYLQQILELENQNKEHLRKIFQLESQLKQYTEKQITSSNINDLDSEKSSFNTVDNNRSQYNKNMSFNNEKNQNINSDREDVPKNKSLVFNNKNNPYKIDKIVIQPKKKS